MKCYRLGDWTVDPGKGLIERGAVRRRLQGREMDLLLRLVEAEGVVVSKDELIRDVWGDRIVVDHVLPKTISSLRKALEESSRRPKIIQTLPKRGYRLGCPVRPVDERPAARTGSWLRSRPFLRAAAVGAWVVLPALTGPFSPSWVRSAVTIPQASPQIPIEVKRAIKIEIATDLEGESCATPAAEDAASEATRHEFAWDVKIGT